VTPDNHYVFHGRTDQEELRLQRSGPHRREKIAKINVCTNGDNGKSDGKSLHHSSLIVLFYAEEKKARKGIGRGANYNTEDRPHRIAGVKSHAPIKRRKKGQRQNKSEHL